MYIFNLFCVTVIIYAVGHNQKVRKAFARQNLFVKLLVVDACIALLLGIPAAFDESSFLPAAIEGTLAWFLHGFIIIVAVGGGFWVGEKVYDSIKRRSQRAGMVLAACLGFTIFFCTGIALRYVFVKIPGVGPRLEEQMLSTEMGSNTALKPTPHDSAVRRGLALR